MPKETFYKIKEEKQKNIINAGQELFSQNYYEKVDVKMIVEAASIPRGSFYAYFKDIKDFYLTVIKTLQNTRIEDVKKLTSDDSLSFFEVLLGLFKYDILNSLHSDQNLLIQHYFRYIMTQDLGFIESKERPIYKVLDKYKTEFSFNKNEWIDFLEFSMNTYLFTYMKAIEYNLDLETSIALFEKRIKTIERGIKW